MREGLKAQLSGNSDNWSTPRYLLKLLEKDFGKFDYDPCPLKSDDKTSLFKDWKGNVFCNPPYSNVEEFLNKGILEIKKENVKQAIFLIIPRTSTKYWQKYVMTYADEIHFINKRLKFGSSNSCAPFPSCIIKFTNTKKKDYVKTYVYDLRKKVGGFTLPSATSKKGMELSLNPIPSQSSGTKPSSRGI